VIDEQDRPLRPAIERLGLQVTATPTIMRDAASRAALARAVIEAPAAR